MFRQLLWKEWRENLWKLTFGGAVSVVFVLLLFRIRLFPDAANCVAISFVQMLVVPVIYALDIFSGEIATARSTCCLSFLCRDGRCFLPNTLSPSAGRS